jgi:arylsulfatase A-like enzyme
LITDDPFVAKHPSAAGFVDTQVVDLPAVVRKPAKEIESTQMAAFFAKGVDQLAKEPVGRCLWLHTRGMAGPWDAPQEMRKQFADEEDPESPSFTTIPNLILPEDYDPDELLGITHGYAGQISLFDACLGVFLAAFDESPLAANTLFLLVGVRGFPLGEHLRVGECDAALYNELTHVPLVVRYPDQCGALARSQALVSHEDVSRILAEWLEIKTNHPPAVRYRALANADSPVWRDHLIFRSARDRAIRTPAWYLRESDSGNGPKRELYVKPDDRWEVNDVADRCADITTQLIDVLATPPTDSPAPLAEALVTGVE